MSKVICKRRQNACQQYSLRERSFINRKIKYEYILMYCSNFRNYPIFNSITDFLEKQFRERYKRFGLFILFPYRFSKGKNRKKILNIFF